jgi:glyoxylase-like metal-dependent hydrolase (beta-lactamase superfamily II)/rhodanese-related sulfurtransferase
MFFKPYYLGCLAHASYLIGGDNGEAAVIDPRRDVDEYIADAEAAGLKIKHVIESHLHADFVSGHVELARRTGARIYLGPAKGVGFGHRTALDGDDIEMGDVKLSFLETPGHTMEGVTVLAHVDGERKPRMAFTGDTLFIGDVGRPDLASGANISAEQMARIMFRTLKHKIVTLPDETEVWPAHGAGSSCGKALSDDRVSTIGREKSNNPALWFVVNGDEPGFVRYATEGLGSAPVYFAHDARKNLEGARTIEEILAAAKPMTPHEVEEESEEGTLVLDTRSVTDFGDGHVPGAINVQLEGKFAPWVGNVVPPDSEIIVVAEKDRESESIMRLARIGYEKVKGFLAGGMDDWRSAGGEVVRVPQLDPGALIGAADLAVLDVRSPSEWECGHVDGSVLIPLPELQKRLEEAPPGPLAVLCGSGYRSSIACSILQRAGRRDVSKVIGGGEAYEACIN